MCVGQRLGLRYLSSGVTLFLYLHTTIFQNMKTIIFNRILEAVETATEIDRALILSRSKQSDIVEARCLLFHYLHKAGFYPSQIARTTNQSRQCVNCLLLSFQARCDFSGNMLKRYVKKLDVELSEYILPPE